MNREDERRQALASHRVLVAAQERERAAELAKRQDEHIARERAAREGGGNEQEI